MSRKFAAALFATVLLPIGALAQQAAMSAGVAGADTVSVPLACLVTGIPVIGSQTATRDQVISATATTHVYQNDTFTVALTPAPGNESADLGSGATLRNIRNLHYRTSVPANSQLVGQAAWSGGSGLNSTPTISSTNNGAAGTVVEVTVPGPINAGTNYQLPTVTMTLKATGAAPESRVTAD